MLTLWPAPVFYLQWKKSVNAGVTLWWFSELTIELGTQSYLMVQFRIKNRNISRRIIFYYLLTGEVPV